MKILILVICISVSLAVPALLPRRHKILNENFKIQKILKEKSGIQADGPDCGAYYYKKFVPQPRPPNRDVDFWCEMCDDIVQIVEMFANCAADYIVNQADMWCDQQCGNDAVLASICHDLVDNIYIDVKNITNTNYTVVCSKLLSKDC
uniref:Saposin B-type domain-containing protein n=1 Tax=Acrobeloides nanus TaxID=290746 RepID=A0A914C9P7_9BILA